jgi:signal transduction histidine kinase
VLVEFIVANREAIIARTREKVATRLAPRPTEQELTTGVPLFLDQFVDTLQIIKTGRAPVGGSVADVLARSLQSMTGLVNRALVEVRLDSGSTRPQRIHLNQLIEDAGIDGTMEAGGAGVSLSVTPMHPSVEVDADPAILSGAIANLLQNAFKFTKPGGHVALKVSAVGDRVEIAIEDECGAPPPGKGDQLFGAFQQQGLNRSGLGLGLFISRRGVEASGGVIRVRDLPGRGCVFTIDLPLAS